MAEFNPRRHRFIWRLVYGPVRLYLRLRFNYQPRIRPIPTPSLIVSNHCTDWDPLMLGVTIRKQAYFIASGHIFQHPLLGKLLLWLQAPIPRMKGGTAADAALTALRRMRAGCSVAVFAEGNRTFTGMTGEIVESTAKLARISGGCLVTHRFRGGYLTSPRWAGADIRRGKMTGEVVRVLTPAQLRNMTPAEIAEVIRTDIFEDAFATQQAWRVPYRGRRLAEHLERALYICPQCRAIGTLRSKNDTLSCVSCGMTVVYTPFGELVRPDGSDGSDTVLKLKALFRYRAQSLGIAAFSSEYKVLFDTFSLGKKYDRPEGPDGETAPFRSVSDWDLWQAGELLRRVEAAGDEPVASDGGVTVYALSGIRDKNAVAAGEMTAYRDRFVCGGLAFPFAALHDAALVGPQTLTLSNDEGYFSFESDAVWCARKYLAVYRAAVEPDRILGV